MHADSLTHERQSVLLIDDNDDHAVLVRRTLHKVQPELDLVHVEDGEQALRLLLGTDAVAAQSPRCALILLDLRLPGLDGIEVLRALREARKRVSAPVIVLTTSDADADVSAAYENGAQAYVVKPSDLASFSELIRDVARFWLGWNKTPNASG